MSTRPRVRSGGITTTGSSEVHVNTTKMLKGLTLAFLTTVFGCLGKGDIPPDETAETESGLTKKWQCTGDTAWSGSTACFKDDVQYGAWQHTFSNGLYGDMMYTTSSGSGVTARWEWQAFPVGGTYAEYEVYIPSTNATAEVSYALCCSLPSPSPGGCVAGSSINQLNISNQWVKIGRTTAVKGARCSVEMFRKDSTSTKKMAADGARVTVY